MFWVLVLSLVQWVAHALGTSTRFRRRLGDGLMEGALWTFRTLHPATYDRALRRGW
jgi:hypothetical protein